jgi:D-2-hydroxyglutarate dehydrogenase
MLARLRTGAWRNFSTQTKLAVASRDPKYANVTNEDLVAFRTMTSSVLEGAEACAPFNGDWMNKWEGQSQVVLRPSCTQEVSEILAYCNERRLAVVPQGGKTGLVGGSVPVHDEVVLSLVRMNKIESFDSDTVGCCRSGHLV